VKKAFYGLLLSLCLPLQAAEISLIIDDVGYNPQQGVKALEMPGKIVYGILPGTPHATMLAEMAHAQGKEILVHIPMESEHHKKLGPDALTQNMSEEQYKQTVESALETVPYAVGFNNHMGSLLTQLQQPMQWLMDVIEEKQLLFLDSRTTTGTVAESVAKHQGVPAFRRDVFLDNERDEAAITKQFQQLVRRAKRRGYATGIGHPYPETMAVINKQFPLLKEQGVELVFLSDRLQKTKPETTEQERSTAWQESSYHSPKVVKNLKP